MGHYKVRVMISGSRSMEVHVEASNGEDAKQIAEAQTGGRAAGITRMSSSRYDRERDR